MTVENRQVKRAARQLFASSRAIAVPFYNRKDSKAEIEKLFDRPEKLQGSVVVISAPMGTGKTFFIDQVAGKIGLGGRAKPLLVGEVDEEELKAVSDQTVFLDEADIKSNWGDVVRGAEIFGEHIRETKKSGVLLGDFTLRNPELRKKLPEVIDLKRFEPLDIPFLKGVLNQRFKEYLDEMKGAAYFERDLLNVLIPDGTAHVNSFRAILTFLGRLVDTMRNDREPFQVNLGMAQKFMNETFEPVLTTDRQAEFLNLFLDFLADNHPQGVGLENGFSDEEIIVLARQVGFEKWDEVRDEIIDPFGEQGFLLARGVPGLNKAGQFERWREPYFPSLHLLLLSGM